MGFVLSILYFIISYLTPATIFGPLAQFRVEMILAALLLILSLPKLAGSLVLKTPQSIALIGLSLATFLSILFGMHWPSGAILTFMAFIPNVYFYFLAGLHCNSRKKLQVVALMLFFVCLFVTVHGAVDLLHGVPESGPSISASTGTIDSDLWDSEHPYLFPMTNSSGEWFFRLRGLGMINDPNDFGQLVVCVIPLMFLFWRPRKMIANIPFVIVPVCVLLVAIFLTHSRGALLAVTAQALVAARRRIGTIPAVAFAGMLLAAAMALQFTGGREISTSAGEDRTGLWGEGLETFKSHPLFGIGYGQLSNYTDNHLTAHNSVVLCAAELGMFGLYFWSLFLFPTVRDVQAIASPDNIRQEVPSIPEESLYPQMASKVERLDKADIDRLGRLLLLSLTGFLVTAWFLSRAFATTLFLLGGMTEVVYQMALQRGMIGPRLPFARVSAYSAGLAAGLLAAIYVVLRFVNLSR